MKKLHILILLLTVAAGANGQGTMWGRVRFANTSSTLITTNSYLGGPASGPMSGPPGMCYFGLFMAPAGTTDKGAFVFTGAYATNLSTPGRLTGGDAEVPGSTGMNLFAFLVRGWSANIGYDYPTVQAYLANPSYDGWFGESEIGMMQPNLPEGPYPNIFGLNPGLIPGFNLELYSIPEPSMYALAALCAAVWRFSRYRADPRIAKQRSRRFVGNDEYPP